MTQTTEFPKLRSIKKYDVITPILIPSFSSKGFPDIREIWNAINSNLQDQTLISLYDLHHHLLPEQLNDAPPLLFLDSGGYEAVIDQDLSDIYGIDHHPRQWNEDLYHKAIRNIDTNSSIVLTTFDNQNEESIASQLLRGLRIQSEYPDYAITFLVKPFQANTINVEMLVDVCPQLSAFDVIGFTEKELGNSLIERLKNVKTLRSAFDQADLDLPIHIFGCLDPYSIFLYFLSGADIFDGLTWLRLAYHQGSAVYRQSWAIKNSQIQDDDQLLRLKSWLENIKYLMNLQKQLRQFASSYNSSILQDFFKDCNRILHEIGISSSEELRSL